MRGLQPHAAPWRDPWIAAALLVGLMLRLAMARGGLWLDEAWSAVLAHDVGTPLGVLTSINHDNNHPLNSWWLQLVGPGAPPLLARALSIACSVATILPAAAFAARRGAGAGRIAAWLFALSPMLVLLGSEARGYAPMLFALVILIEQVDPLRAERPTPTSLALIGLLGTLGHLLMLPAILLAGLWLALARSDWRQAWPALAASLWVVAVLLGGAYAAQGGFTIGSSTVFGWPGFAAALVELARLSLGTALLVVVVVIALLLPPRPTRTDATLWLTLGLGLPLAVLVFHPANSQISRYYLLSTLALLWLVASRAGALAKVPVFAALLLAPLVLAMAVTDAGLIAATRAEPDLPVRRIAIEHPGPARLLIGASRLSAVVTIAAAEQRAAVTPVGPACTPADYLLFDLTEAVPPPRYSHCGASWLLLDYRDRPYRDGVGWALYRRTRSASPPLYRRTGLPAPGPVASGPRPAL